MIGDKTLELAGERIGDMLRSYRTKINHAYLNADEELKISISLNIRPGGGTSSFRLEAGINFITERIKDVFTFDSDENQEQLFERHPKDPATGTGELKRCPVRPDGDLRIFWVYTSYCNNTCPLRRETLLVDGNGLPKAVSENEAGFLVVPDGAMVQYRSCSAWSDEDTKDWVDAMLEEIDHTAADASTIEKP